MKKLRRRQILKPAEMPFLRSVANCTFRNQMRNEGIRPAGLGREELGLLIKNNTIPD
jgi:hypothetical protein